MNMSDIELVIKISEDDLKIVADTIFTIDEMFDTTRGRVYRAIVNGTVLPKRHGKIIDESTITEVYTHETEPKRIHGILIPPSIEIVGTNAPTIIEAGVESEDDEND
jgi:hypothetical protein